MTSLTQTITLKEKVISFIWQHFLLAVSLFIMTFGVSLCVRSSLGSSVISTIPFVMTLAGEKDMAPQLTIGEYTYIMNFLLVALQILILRRRFQPVQLFQLIIGFAFGYLLDINMWLTEGVVADSLAARALTQLAGCAVLAAGISFEVKCGSVTMPGEGITVAVSQAAGMPFAKTKIIVDIAMVAVAVAAGYIFFGTWMWQVVGPGTLFAMIFVGAAVRYIAPKIGWFDRLLYYRPGFRRHIYGLARYIYRRFS